jgi:cell shape-determining protein MreD
VRVVAQVFLAYGLVLVASALWRLLPLGRATPDLVALSAIYLGLTARARVAPAVLGAVIVGYLADLLFGLPRGLLASTAGVVCLLGHLVQGRLIVRGRLFTLIFSVLVGLAAGLVALALRAASGMAGSDVGDAIGGLLLSALLSGLVGPLFFRLSRQVDARFARTQRERDAALEGLIP